MLNDHTTTTTTQNDPVIDAAVRVLRDVPVSGGPPAAFVAAVRESGRGVILVEHRPLPRRRAILAGLAAAAAVVLVTGLLPSLRSDRKASHSIQFAGGIAFGDVIGELRKVRTVKYREVSSDMDGDESVSLQTVAMDGKFARSEMLDEKGVVRTWAVYNAGRMLNVDPVGRTARLTDYTTDDGVPHSLADQHTLADLLKIDPAKATSLGQRELDRRQLTGFQVNRDYDMRNLRSVEVWVDPATRLPVRVEQTTKMRYPDDAATAELHRRDEGRRSAALPGRVTEADGQLAVEDVQDRDDGDPVQCPRRRIDLQHRAAQGICVQRDESEVGREGRPTGDKRRVATRRVRFSGPVIRFRRKQRAEITGPLKRTLPESHR